MNSLPVVENHPCWTARLQSVILAIQLENNIDVIICLKSGYPYYFKFLSLPSVSTQSSHDHNCADTVEEAISDVVNTLKQRGIHNGFLSISVKSTKKHDELASSHHTT